MSNPLSLQEDDILEDALVAAKFKFMVHRRKGGWRHKGLTILLKELKKEIIELSEAVDEGNVEHIITESADVVNYAAMIIDTAKRSKI